MLRTDKTTPHSKKENFLRDDGAILKWNNKTGETATITKLPEGVYPADMAWFPSNVGGRQSASELFVLGTTDGGF